MVMRQHVLDEVEVLVLEQVVAIDAFIGSPFETPRHQIVQMSMFEFMKIEVSVQALSLRS